MQTKLIWRLLLCVSLFFSTSVSAQSTGTLYFSSGATNTQLYRVDNPGTASVSATPIGSPYSTIYNGIGYYNGLLYGITINGDVVSINPTTGAVSLLGISLPGGHNYASGDIANGILYTSNIDGGASNHYLYRVNIANGSYTSVPLAGQFPDFVYYNGYLYGAAGLQGSMYIYQIDPSSATMVQVGGNIEMGPGAAAWTDGSGMIYFDRKGTFNVNTGVATANSSVGTTMSGVAGSGSGYDDATLLPASNTPLTNGGTIAANQTQCGAFDPAMLTSITPASGGSGPGAIQYRWWANGSLVTGATGSTYDPGPITVTTSYQREANRIGTSGWVASNVVTATVENCTPLTNGGTIAADQAHCGPFDPAALTSVSPASGGTGSGAIQYRWWVNGSLVAGATGSTYDPGPITVNTTYMREANRVGTVGWVASNVVTASVDACNIDFTVTLEQSGSSILSVGNTLPITVYVTNLTGTAGPCSFTVSRPSPASGLTMTLGTLPTGWTMSSTATQYIFTSNGNNVDAYGSVSLPVTITRTGGTPGAFTLNATITAPNDSDPTNNNAIIVITRL